MMSNPIFLLSLLMSSLIAFVTVAIVVESAIVLFRIGQGRMRALLRILPFASVVLDLLADGIGFGYWLNPLNCSSCAQNLILTLFFPELKSYLYSNEISLISYLGSELSHIAFSVIFTLFLAATVYAASRFFIEAYLMLKFLRSIRSSAEMCTRSIENLRLAVSVKANGVKIYTNDQTAIPMATFSKAIFIPRKIVETFPQDEFEAIVAHELEHVIWRDPLIRFLVHLTSAIFWWVPTKSVRKKLDFDQEAACDQSILKYGFKDEFLASALIKVTAALKEEGNAAFCYLSNERHPSFRRVQMILGLTSKDDQEGAWISCLVFSTALVTGLVCVFWA